MQCVRNILRIARLRASKPLVAALWCWASLAAHGQPNAPSAAAAISGEEQVVEMRAHRRSGALSWWLANGVRCIHLRGQGGEGGGAIGAGLDELNGQAMVSILLGGGEMLEDDRTRGLTAMVAVALDRPAGRIVEPDMLDELMGGGGRDVHLQVSAASDGLVLRISGSTEDLAAGLQAAAVLLTQPLITEAGLARAREVLGGRQATVGLKRALTDDLPSQVMRAIVAGCVGGEPAPGAPCVARLAALDPQHVAKYCRHDVQAWVDRLVTCSPLEAAFVGDIDRERAMELSAMVLGTLRKRPRPEHARATLPRLMPAPDRPELIELLDEKPAGAGRVMLAGMQGNAADAGDVEVAGGGLVCVGLLGPDLDRTGDLRALRVGLAIAAERSAAKLESRNHLERAAHGRVLAQLVLPSPGAAGFGIAMLCASCDGAAQHLEPMRTLMLDEISLLARDGPSQDELERAVAPLIETVERFEHDPRYVSALLSRAGWRGVDPDQAVGGAAHYAEMRPGTIADALRRYDGDQRRFTVTKHASGD